MTAAVAQLLLGAITAVLSLQLPLGTFRLPGSGLFPLALGLLLAALSAIQIARLMLARRAATAAAAARPVAPQPATQQPAAPKPAQADGATRRVALFMAVVAASVALLQVVGYVVSSLLLMLGLLKVLGVGWRAAVLIAACSAAGAHVLFVMWLKIPMPPGPLGF
jgi:hypothetical protein